MRILTKLSSMVMVVALLFTFACQQRNEVANPNEIPQTVLNQIKALGFTNTGVLATDGGYIVEGDIFLSNEALAAKPQHRHLLRIAEAEQYRTNNVVVTGGSRNITMYAPTGRKGYDAAMLAGLDEAIARYNAMNLDITFSRVSSSGAADIVMSRLSKRDERRGVLGSAGFPTASGDPYNQIKMSGILQSSYGLSTNGIATIIAHEMGHCIGFRHTDYFNRAISCGGSAVNEGDGGVGAILIPGTSSGADLSGNGSWMLSCSDGSDRPFTNGDQTALNWMYNGNF